MATRRIILGAIALIVFAMLLSQAAIAYDDTKGMGAHSMINQLAYESFQKNILPNDPYLKNCSLIFDQVRGRGMLDGITGDFPADIDDNLLQQRDMKSWIVFGGYTADEPELPNALTHFYNPGNTNTPWLTNQQYPVTFYKYWKWDNNVVNPQITAKELAMHGTKNMQTGQFNEYFIKLYCWDYGKRDLQLALKNSDNNNEYYGRSWRSLGEVMHLMADMTLPAHVRNDGHAATLKDTDPVEGTTTWGDIETAAKGYSSPSITYYTDNNVASSPGSLFDQVAKWTNKNFLSKDTIYQLDLNGRAHEKDGYMYWTIDGSEARAAKINKNYWVDLDNPKISYTIDRAVVNSQLSFLIPTAVKADATLIDRFLPRFYSTVSQSPGEKGATDIHVSLIQKLSEEWPETLAVNNGAYLVINGKKDPVTMGDGGSLNGYVVTQDLKQGDTVYALYDLGGYEIRSNTITIEAPKSTPKPAHSDPKVVKFSGPTEISGPAQDLTFTYSVTMNGGTPPYFYTWCGDGRRVLFDGKEYNTVTVKATDIRWNGEGYAISLFVRDSAGEGAYWVDSVGTSSTEFVYYITRGGTVQKPRGL